jgi:AraC-like DNA-binding protein
MLLDSGVTAHLAAGDLALAAPGISRTRAGTEPPCGQPLAGAMEPADLRGPGRFMIGSSGAKPDCRVVCGQFSFADGADHPLLRAIPPILWIGGAERAASPLLNDVVSLIARRTVEDAPGAVATVERLSEVLFIEVLRAAVAQSSALAQFMQAVSDPQIGKALALIHGEVAMPWTVASLASSIGMSRSRFAEKFSELVGKAPLAYVAEWRLQRALARLAEPGPPIAVIAHDVGYRSAAAFTRAFTNYFGHSPRTRRQGVSSCAPSEPA